MEDKKHHDGCACGHDHGHHHRPVSGFALRLAVSISIVAGLLFLLKPFLVQQMFVRVSSYLACASYGDAMRVCKKIVCIDGNNLKAWSSLGYVYQKSGPGRDAVAAYEKVLSVDPGNRSALFDLGMIHFSEGEIPEALPYFKSLYNAGPDPVDPLEVSVLDHYRGAFTMLRECYKRTGDAARAGEIEQEMEEKYPQRGRGAGRIGKR
jgi:tetratricopeptide (TPR) repeat protein